MKIELQDFRAPGGEKINLRKWPTYTQPNFRSPEHYKELRAADTAELSALQRRLYADNRYALLLIFQGMDAGGKDGAISHVMAGVNPQGCEVHSFKHPSAEELDHDFLWRTNRRLPARGRIGIFNRSYYEEVLIVRVHPEILRAQKIPDKLVGKKTFWKRRYRSIVDLERHLHRSGTRVLKFFLHLSKEEQRKRFLARIDEPDKNWKFSEADLAERGHWDEYQRAYADCLSATSTKHAPWHVVPADDKQNARLIISRAIIEELQSLKLQYPAVTPARRRELQTIRRQLAE